MRLASDVLSVLLKDDLEESCQEILLNRQVSLADLDNLIGELE
jgi:hypothetical protein